MKSEDVFTQKANPLLGDKVKLWKSRDLQGSEIEVGECLAGIIRLTKPKVVVETGCYMGDSTIAMAKALKKNKFGKLYSCDTNAKLASKVRARIKLLDLSKYAEVFVMSGDDLIEKVNEIARIDFAFIDSSDECAIREYEIELLVKYLFPRKMFAVHDTAPQHAGMVQVMDKVHLPKIYFDTPRGLTLVEIPHK